MLSTLNSKGAITRWMHYKHTRNDPNFDLIFKNLERFSYKYFKNSRYYLQIKSENLVINKYLHGAYPLIVGT